MNDKELIEFYILSNYTFTSNQEGWRIIDDSGKVITLKHMIRFINRVFPNMDSIKIVNDWFTLNITTVIDKIKLYLSNYKLVLGFKRKVWDVINTFGKHLDINELYNIAPQHTKHVIRMVYDDWFRDMTEIETKKMIGC